MPAEARRRRLCLACVLAAEANLQQVPVLHDVALALQPLETLLRRLGARTALVEVTPVDHLTADEAVRHVRVHGPRSVERGLTPAERPGTRLGLVRREEGDQAECLLESEHHLVEGGRSFTEGGRLLVGELGELGLELSVNAPRAVYERDDRLRGQGLQLGGQLAREVTEGAASVEMRKHCLELGDLAPKRS